MGFATFLFRTGKNGQVEGRVFDSDEHPGGDWVDSPAKCKHVTVAGINILSGEISQEELQAHRQEPREEHKAKKAHKLETRDDLIAEAERLALTIDRRWGISKLRKILGLD